MKLLLLSGASLYGLTELKNLCYCFSLPYFIGKYGFCQYRKVEFFGASIWTCPYPIKLCCFRIQDIHKNKMTMDSGFAVLKVLLLSAVFWHPYISYKYL